MAGMVLLSCSGTMWDACEYLSVDVITFTCVSTAKVMYEKSNTYGTVVMTTIRYVISEILLVDFARYKASFPERLYVISMQHQVYSRPRICD